MSVFRAPAKRVDKMAFGRPTHYYVDADGKRIPGVTTILGNGLPKPALVNWAGNATAAYAVDNWDDLGDMSVSDRLAKLKKARYEERDAAAKRGTEVHALAEQIADGHEVAVPDELRGHVESYVAYLDEWEPTPILQEVTVVSYEYGYAGTLDMIVRYPSGAVCLNDIKTSKGVYGEVALQLAAYRYADVYLAEDGTERPLPQVDDCQVIHVRADGYDVVPMVTDRHVFDDFRRVAATARVMDRLNDYRLPILEKP
jgi:hypothetical protein